MAWTPPMTAVANATFFASEFNTHIRDNLNETSPGKATTSGSHFIVSGTNTIVERRTTNAFVGTNESTTSTTYTDLATPGPAVTVATSTRALVLLYTQMGTSVSSGAFAMGYAVSGATTIAASDPRALVITSGTVGHSFHVSATIFDDILTAGSNTFTAKYRSHTAGGVTTGFSSRRICVIPF